MLCICLLRFRAAPLFCGVLLACLSSPLCIHAAPPCWTEEDEIETRCIDELSRCVVYLENSAGAKYITGLLVDAGGPAVLTNYHVLSSDTDTVRVYLNTAGGSASAFACRLVKGDRMRDLAAFRIGAAALPPGNDCLPRARFAGPGAVHRGRRILFLGFPLNYGMQADPEGGGLRKLPIARTGIIASEPGVDEFLIDAMVSNGNSGSPVFVRAGKGRRAAPGYRLAGIMKEFQHDTIPLRRDDGSARKIPHNTGLAAVIPADAIAAFLENLPGVP